MRKYLSAKMLCCSAVMSFLKNCPRQNVFAMTIANGLLILNSSVLYAASSISPEISYDGTFTVSGIRNALHEIKSDGTTQYIASGSSYTVMGKPPGTYSYQSVYSVDVTYGGTVWRSTSPIAVEVRNPGVPGTPSTNGTSPPLSTQNYSISWSAASTPVGQYELQERIDNGSWSTVQKSSKRDKIFGNRSPGRYCYRVRSLNGLGSSAYSENLCLLIKLPTDTSVTLNYQYDSLGRLITVEQNGNAITDYNYDDAGNRTSVTDKQ